MILAGFLIKRRIIDDSMEMEKCIYLNVNVLFL